MRADRRGLKSSGGLGALKNGDGVCSFETENSVIVPWLDLPDHLTEKILERLPIVEYIRFGYVCRHWRSIQTAHRRRHAPAHPQMVNLPWFIPHRPKRESVLCSVGLFRENLNGRQSRQLLHIPLSPRYVECLSRKKATEGGGRDGRVPAPASSSLPHGRLLLDDWPLPRSLQQIYRGYKFTLLNPINGFQIQLPYLGSLYDDTKATMSPPPRWDIFLIASNMRGLKLHLCRLVNPCWTSVDYSYKDFSSGVLMAMASAIHHKGKFYCLFLGKGLMVVDVDCPIEDDITGHYFEMDQSHLPKVNIVEDGLEIFLVESNGKMLLVSKFFEYDPSFTTRTLERVELCEADLSNRRWVNVESLGDQSLFIYRNFVVSLLAADVGVKENCIYILDPTSDSPMPWSVFDFGTGKVTDASLACPQLPSTHLMFVPSMY